MKLSIRTKFSLGMIFIFIIILTLIGFSSFYLNNTASKIGAILKENYLSVVYAREMNEALININQAVITDYLSGKPTDRQLIDKEFEKISHSLQMEMNNITEHGEDKLVSGIEKGLSEYRDSLNGFLKSGISAKPALFLEKKFGLLSQQLVLLSQMNGKAIEVKTDSAKAYSGTALTQMSILGTLSFLIALGFIYSFASYFNERFFQLYNGIREIASSNYGQRLYFDGMDEFYEISLLFNQMAEKLSGEKNIIDQFSFEDSDSTEPDKNKLDELASILIRIKSIEKQVKDYISRLGNTSK